MEDVGLTPSESGKSALWGNVHFTICSETGFLLFSSKVPTRELGTLPRFALHSEAQVDGKILPERHSMYLISAENSYSKE